MMGQKKVCEEVINLIFETYHEVAYRTNTLAAFPMAVLASLAIFTFSGSCDREASVSIHHNICISVVQ